MEITIKADSQDLNYTQLSTYLRHFNESREIDINFNGLKYKGIITEIVWRQNSMNVERLVSGRNYRVIKITVFIKNNYGDNSGRL